ncbi:MAG: anti-anti-sigma regulatory factor [Arcticibacterium sp.]|jgi:anti-anti-sigma regulatory factor
MTEILITGDFTTEKALEWKTVLNSEAKKETEFAVNLLDVSGADIVGVNALISTHKILSNKGKSLTVKLQKNSAVYELLHLTKFLPILNVKLI